MSEDHEHASVTLDMPAVADVLHVTLNTLNKWAKENTMPAYRVGRSWIVFRAEFDVWLANTSTGRSAAEPLPTLAAMLAVIPPVLRFDAVGELLHVSRATVAALLDSGQLHADNIGSVRRVPIESLRAYLSSARNAA